MTVFERKHSAARGQVVSRRIHRKAFFIAFLWSALSSPIFGEEEINSALVSEQRSTEPSSAVPEHTAPEERLSNKTLPEATPVEETSSEHSDEKAGESDNDVETLQAKTWYAIGLECSTCATPAGQTFAPENTTARTRFADRLFLDPRTSEGKIEERGKEGDFVARKVAFRATGEGKKVIIQYVEGKGERVGDTYAYCWVLKPYAAESLLYGQKYIVQVFDDQAYEAQGDGFTARPAYLSPDLLVKNLLDVRVTSLNADRRFYQAGEKVRFQLVGVAAFVEEDFDEDDIRQAEKEGLQEERDAKGRLDLAIDLIRQGDEAYGAGKLEEALDRYRAASVLAPHLAIVHSDLGAVYQLLKRLPEAEVAYRLALDLNPEDHDTRFNLAVVLEQLGKKEDAVKSYEVIVKKRPADREARDRLTALRRTMSTTP